MKTLYLLVLLSIFSCTGKIVEKEPSAELEPFYSSTNKEEIEQSILNIGSETIMGHLASADSLEVADQTFRMFRFSSGVTYLLDNENNLIYEDEDYSYEQELIDFNHDGYKDLKYKYLTNVPGVDKLLLFDTISNVFREVDNFSKFP
ncbi:MAG: hypothetical protein AAGA31_06620, partial [Bacteroidota bacterium]